MSRGGLFVTLVVLLALSASAHDLSADELSTLSESLQSSSETILSVAPSGRTTAYHDTSDEYRDNSRARHIFESQAWHDLDPHLNTAASHVHIVTHGFGSATILQASPLVNGVKVIGAERVVRIAHDDSSRKSHVSYARKPSVATLSVSDEFRVTAMQAAARATVLSQGGLDALSDEFIKSPLEHVTPAYIPGDNDLLKPVYFVNLKTKDMNGRTTVVVDGDTGDVSRQTLETSHGNLHPVDLLDQTVHRLEQLFPNGVPQAQSSLIGDLSKVSALASDDAHGVELREKLNAEAIEAEIAFIKHHRAMKAILEAKGASQGEQKKETRVDSDRAAKVQPMQTSVDATTFNNDYSGTTNVKLENLVSTAPGSHINGKYFSMRNCCLKLACLVATDTPQVCTATRCAVDADPPSKTWDVPTTKYSIKTSEFLLIREAAMAAYPLGTVYFEGPVCQDLPKARVGADGTVSLTPDPVTSATMDDEYAEVTAYYEFTRVHERMRQIYSPSFCLGGRAQQCDSRGNPILNSDGAPSTPLLVFMNGNPIQSLLTLLATELNNANPSAIRPGTSEANPIKWTGQEKVLNAFYSYPVWNLLVEDLGFPKEIVGSAPTTANADRAFCRFFNGQRNAENPAVVDLGYDRSVVHHEFHHAVTHSFRASLFIGGRWAGFDATGSHDYVGGLHEGYGDYYAAVLNNDGLIGPTIEPVIRDVDPGRNQKRCPRDLNYEVHDDSEMYSSTLLRIRKVIAESDSGHALLFDKLLLQAIALSTLAETFPVHTQRILDLMASDSTLSQYRSRASDTFKEFGLDACERIVDAGEFSSMTEKKYSFITHQYLKTLQLSPATNVIMPLMLQFKYNLDKKAQDSSTLTFTWRSLIMHGGTSTMGTQFDLPPISYDEPYPLLRSYCPITWVTSQGTGFGPLSDKLVTSVRALICDTPGASQTAATDAAILMPTVKAAEGTNIFLHDSTLAIPVSDLQKGNTIYFQPIAVQNVFIQVLNNINRLTPTPPSLGRFLGSYAAGISQFRVEDPAVDKSLSTGAIVGIAAGSIIFVGLVIAGTIVVYRRSKSTPKHFTGAADPQAPSGSSSRSSSGASSQISVNSVSVSGATETPSSTQ